jgi:acyl carrier protein
MSVDSQAIRDQLRTYILQSFLPGEDPSNLQDDTPLKGSGILDSISTLKLVTHVEDAHGITVAPHEASTEFDTIDSIAALIERKR